MVTANIRRKLDIEEQPWHGECDPLATRWPDFVGYSQRLQTEGPFLKALLQRYGNQVLDAAMGIGCESVFLAKQDAKVTGNEISPRFREQARMRARREGVELKLTAIDWRNLAKVFNPDSFDLVLVLGNSLCLMEKSEDQREAIRNFKAVCRPGGAIVVDQRNFDYMFEKREEILLGHFRYSGNVMYCGTKVRGYPVDIDSNCVRFAYEDMITKRLIGNLDMHPFRRHELVDLFISGGLVLEESYSDFIPHLFDPSADFYTHVFRKVDNSRFGMSEINRS